MRCIVLLLIVLAWAEIAFSDTVRFVNNSIINGHVTFDGETVVVAARYSSGPKTFSFEKAKIQVIEFNATDFNSGPAPVKIEIASESFTGSNNTLAAYIPQSLGDKSADLLFVTNNLEKLIVKYHPEHSENLTTTQIETLSGINDLSRAQARFRDLQPDTYYRWQAEDEKGRILGNGGFKTIPADSKITVGYAWPAEINQLAADSAAIQCKNSAVVKYGTSPDALDHTAKCQTINGSYERFCATWTPRRSTTLRCPPASGRNRSSTWPFSPRLTRKRFS